MVPPGGATLTRGSALRSGASRSLVVALVGLAVAAAVMGGVGLVLALEAGMASPTWPIVLFTVVGWLYVAAGLLAWSRRPNNPTGALITVGGAVLLVVNLANTRSPLLVAAALVFATVPLAIPVHLLLAFPSGRLRSPASRALVAAVYATSLLLQAPQYLFRPAPPPGQLLAVADRADLAALGARVQAVTGGAIMVATTVVLLARLRRAEPVHRRILTPVYGFGVFAVLFIPISAQLLTRLLHLSPEILAGLQLLDLAVIPIAFALGVLRGRFARTGQIEELGAWLGTAAEQRPDLAEALARTLGDPSLQLVYWLPESREYVGESGQRVELPTGAGRKASEIDLRGHRVGAVIYSDELVDDPQLVAAAGEVVAIAVDRERLTAALLATEQALRASRTRLIETADRERLHLARDLHDGLQVRLVLLGMQAQQLAEETTDPCTVGSATQLRESVDAAAAELRRLVHAVMPAELIEGGLSAATEELLDRLPMPTRLDMTLRDRRLPLAVESTAFFVVAEAVANTLKHSSGHSLHVQLAESASTLRVEVSDDGIGGATLDAGTGLRGLADRVESLGGRFSVVSPPGQGTQLRAELPCAS